MECLADKTGPTDFYPASGYRYSRSGGLDYVGMNGYAWSGAPLSATSTNGSLLGFANSNVNPEGTFSRAYGFPVRGVKDVQR